MAIVLTASSCAGLSSETLPRLAELPQGSKAISLQRPAPGSSWQRTLSSRLLAAERPVFPYDQRTHMKPRTSPARPLRRRQYQPTYEYPIDLGYQWRAVPEFCPDYLPEQYPGRSLDEFCYESYITSPWLKQDGWANPFQIAEEEVQAWNVGKDVGWRRVALAAAYAARNWRAEDLAGDIVAAVLGRQRHLSAELIMDVAIPYLAGILPEELVEIRTEPGETAIDLLVETNTSYDSAACTQDMLLTAAARGLRAVVVADRNRLDGAQRAQRMARRLQAQGRLPTDFQVVIGEQIQTLSGAVLGLFLEWRVPEQMTMKKTLDMIHKQGGLAVLVHPGALGGPRLLREMPFDGYLIQPGMFQMFRTLSILYDPRLADKPALYASNSPYAAGVGLPFSIVETADTSPESLKNAVANGQVWAAGGLYLPWMALAALQPLGSIETVLNRFFVWHDGAESKLCRLLGADNVAIETSWDRELQGWMGLDRLPEGLRRIGNRTSPLLELPRVNAVAVEYSYFQLRYWRREQQITLAGRHIW